MTVLVDVMGARPVVGRRPATGLRLLGLVAFCALGVGLGVLVARGSTAPSLPGLPGLSDAGDLTRRLLPLSRAAFDLTAVGAVGTLVAAGWLLPPGSAEGDRDRLLRASARWGAAWSVAALVQLLLTTSTIVGVPLGSLLRSPTLLAYGSSLPQGRALGAAGPDRPRRRALGEPVAVRAGRARGRCGGSRVDGPAAGHRPRGDRLEPPARQPDRARARAGRDRLDRWPARAGPAPAQRRGPPRGRAALQPGGPGLLRGRRGLRRARRWTRVGFDADVWTSPYGILLLAKTGALLALGALGWWHRARTVPAVVAGRPRAFLRLAGAEVLVMATAVGLAVVLARTPPPVRSAVRSVPPHAARFPTIDATTAPADVRHLLLDVRPDALLLAASAALLVAVWPPPGASTRGGSRGVASRSSPASVVTTWSMAGGLGAYATALLSAQVAQLLTLALVAPMLLAAGLPRPLAQECVRRLPGVLRRTENASLLLVVLLAAVFQSSLLELSLHTVLGHLLLTLGVLVAGLLVAVPLLAGPVPDRAGATTLTSGGSVAGLLLLAVVLAVYGWRLHAATAPAVGGFFTDLSWWWADMHADQALAGTVMLAFAAALLGGSLVLGRALSRRA